MKLVNIGTNKLITAKQIEGIKDEIFPRNLKFLRLEK